MSLLACLSLVTPVSAASGPSEGGAAERDSRIVHALSRLGFGARPGDLERVRSLGLERWIELQLHPERLPDPAPARVLEPLATQRLSTAELLRHYDIPPQARQELQRRQAEMEAPGGNPERERQKLRRDLMAKYPELEGAPRQVLSELQQAKLIRAVASERQLEEVMADFWFNHFNVFADKGPEKLLLPEYERAVIRKHALGRFEELLLATAQSPAMLFYLDNWLSAAPGSGERLEHRRAEARRRAQIFARRAGRRAPPMPDAPAQPERGPRRSGLNENYAREVMELHTLGVDGGYTQQDVTEVARCFTGWTIEGLRQQDPRFRFVSLFHDPGDKLVLGHRIKGSGQGEGEAVIHLLASHPATARFISTKLARRFVADDPPPALVERMAATFERSGGEIRKVLETLFASAEFWDARQAKVKTPFEFVVSALRASGASVDDARALAQRVAAMGMPLYQQQPPTGYKDTAEAWVSTSGLLARLNFALDLAAGRVRGVRVAAAALAPEAGDGTALADALGARLVPAGLSDATRRTLEASAATGLDAARVAGLILGSPEFQRR